MLPHDGRQPLGDSELLEQLKDCMADEIPKFVLYALLVQLQRELAARVYDVTTD